MSDDKDEVSIKSVFSVKSLPAIKIEFDQDKPGKAILVVGGAFGTPLSEIKTILAAFEDKFPFAFEEKKEG